MSRSGINLAARLCFGCPPGVRCGRPKEAGRSGPSGSAARQLVMPVETPDGEIVRLATLKEAGGSGRSGSVTHWAHGSVGFGVLMRGPARTSCSQVCRAWDSGVAGRASASLPALARHQESVTKEPRAPFRVSRSGAVRAARRPLAGREAEEGAWSCRVPGGPSSLGFRCRPGCPVTFRASACGAGKARRNRPVV